MLGPVVFGYAFLEINYPHYIRDQHLVPERIGKFLSVNFNAGTDNMSRKLDFVAQPPRLSPASTIGAHGDCAKIEVPHSDFPMNRPGLRRYTFSHHAIEFPSHFRTKFDRLEPPDRRASKLYDFNP
jgi:hypothetical protein